MYKTQVYDGTKAQTILAKLAKKRNTSLHLWLYHNNTLIAYVIAEPYDYLDSFKNVIFVTDVTIERTMTGFRITTL